MSSAVGNSSAPGSLVSWEEGIGDDKRYQVRPPRWDEATAQLGRIFYWPHVDVRRGRFAGGTGAGSDDLPTHQAPHSASARVFRVGPNVMSGVE